jgi:four helix bundle protein
MQSAKNLVLTNYVRKLIVLTYQTTSTFPRSELFGLVSQMRRAVVSIGSNIAEGCGRSSDRMFRRSLDEAMAEASEFEFQCWVAHDLGFGNPEQLSQLTLDIERVKRMLARLIVAVRKRSAKNRTEFRGTRTEGRSTG